METAARIVKTRRANVATYKRPSVKAIQATSYKKPGAVIYVYPTIEGWFEIRQVDQNGARSFEFVRRTDVRYTVKYLLTVLIKRVKLIMMKVYKKVSDKRP